MLAPAAQTHWQMEERSGEDSSVENLQSQPALLGTLGSRHVLEKEKRRPVGNAHPPNVQLR